MPLPTLSAHGSSRILLRDEVLARLMGAIIDGTLHPGEHLRDQELVAWLRTSRTPIRESLGRLEAMGLVELIPHRYTRVSPIDPAELNDRLETLVFLVGGIFVELGEFVPHGEFASDFGPLRSRREVISHFWSLTHATLALSKNPTLLNTAATLYPAISRAIEYGIEAIDAAEYHTTIMSYADSESAGPASATRCYRALGEILIAGCLERLEAEHETASM